MTPTEVIYTFRLIALLCAWLLLGGLLGIATAVELIRHRTPESHIVSGYTIAVSATTVAAAAYMLAGDTP